ncbi:MAG: MFS transporter, partial [Candidatus Binataceae bacterium]
MNDSPQPSARSLRGLDWFNFFMADVQTGVGPFVAIYLVSLHWNQENIGWALTVGGLAGVLSQGPAGALIDSRRRKRLLLAAVTIVIAAGALIFLIAPTYPLVMAAQILHGLASGVVGPAIAAVSLGLVGHRLMGERIGRNNVFNSGGNVFSAGLMGVAGFYALPSIFVITILFALHTVFALGAIRGDEIDYARARGAAGNDHGKSPQRLSALLRNHHLMIFAACAVMFHFANAAMLPLLGMMLARGRLRDSSLFMSACVITTQVVITLIAAPIGRASERWGRKPLLLIGFGVLPIRGVLYTLTASPVLLVAIQILDGIGAGIFGVVSILVIADVMQGTGRFNFAQGCVGTAVGIGASLS